MPPSEALALVLPLRFLTPTARPLWITGRSVHAILCPHLSFYDAAFCLSQRFSLWDLILPGGSFDPAFI